MCTGAEEPLDRNVTVSYNKEPSGRSKKIWMEKLHPYKTTSYICLGNNVNHRFENQEKMGGKCSLQGDFNFS